MPPEDQECVQSCLNGHPSAYRHLVERHLNGDWFVPYEIKLKNGSIKKWNLALRPHKAAKRFIVDGGI